MGEGEVAKNGAEVTLKAGCKINLWLRITGVRADGYHEIDSLFLPLDEPHDLMRVRRVPDAQAGQGGGPQQKPRRGGAAVLCAETWFDPRDNTLVKAYEAFAQLSGFSPALEVRLEKGIPAGAGLGGGSSDAAALLLYLNEIAPRPLGMAQLVEAALKVGADVPFFLNNVPSLVRGIGEITAPWAFAPLNMILLLVCPDVAVSTPAAYRRYDEISGRNFTPKSLTSPSSKYNKGGLRLPFLANDLEQAVFTDYPILGRIKTDLFGHGAAAALMSGSGASIFGLFRDENRAEAAWAAMRGQGCRVYRGML